MRRHTTTEDRTRLVLVLGGVGVIAYGVVLVLFGLDASGLVGLGLWLAAALAIHDAVVVPTVAAISRLLFPHSVATKSESAVRGHRLLSATQSEDYAPVFAGSRAAAFTRALLVSASLVSVIVVPEIWAQRRGSANPTILPGAYAQNLLGLWIVVLAITTTVLVIGLVVARRRQRTSLPSGRSQ